MRNARTYNKHIKENKPNVTIRKEYHKIIIHIRGANDLQAA